MTVTPPSSPQVVRFGVFVVDLQAGELYKGGVRLKLQDQPFQILALLLERPGKVVTREEIRQKLWPDGTFVDFEHSLNAAVKRLREALGDSAETPRFVETVPRRGYRLIYPVEWGLRVSRVWIGVLAVGAVLVALLALNVGGLRDRLLGRPLPGEITSIAVLPLENLSGDPEQEFFADGVTEALITELGKISALRVISRQSVMQFKGSDKPLQEIARQLNVDAVVEGAVVREGERVRITAQLVEVSPERHLWSEQYERDIRGILTLQGEVVRAIVQEVRVTITPQEKVRLAAARPVNPEAHQAYLRGRYFWSKRTPDGMKKAEDYFQQAIDIDPTYAPAYSGLADTYGVGPARFLGLTPADRYARTKAAVQKALELDDSLAEAHASLAHIKAYDWDWEGAERALQRAIELNPSYATAHQWLSGSFSAWDHHQESVRHAKHAVELDPLSPIINVNLGYAYLEAGAHDLAIEQCQRTLELDPEMFMAHWCLAHAYVEIGQDDEAARHGEQATLLAEGPEPASQLRERYEAEGWRGVWRWQLERLEARLATGEYVNSTYIAQYHILLGELDKAILALEKGYQRRDSGLIVLGGDPTFDPLRSDPRFQDLVRRMNFPE